MVKMPASESALAERRAWSFDRLFDAARKDTVIRLRWPLVILSSYLLYYTPSLWLSETQVQAVLILYLLSHSTLYFLADELFDSPFFYGPLLVFDSLVLVAVLSTSGTASPDFYLACLLTVILSCICNDTRGLLVVTFLAPAVYGYFVFGSAKTVQPSIYLRLPFPFVISLFYGYFAQVERIRRIAREREEQVKKQQKTAEAIRRQRERLEVLHEVNLSITSTINIDEILDGFLERALIHLPYAAAIVRLRKPESKMLETAASKGIGMMGTHQVDDSLTVVDQVVEHPSPLVVRNVFADPRMENLEFFKEEGLVSLVCVPLLANGQMLGNLVFFTREEHDFGEEEIGFLSTLAGQAAIAIHHSQLFIRSQNQADELRHAHRIKDEFLSSVSNELKTPLSVISGYTDMFMEGLIGTLTPIQEKAVETIARQSKELQRLIDTVLQVSTLAAEQLQAELHDVNLWEFFSELRSNYDDPLAKNVRLVWEYAADLPTVQGDRVKLKHILTNLINNAIKFTNHGTITVSVRYLASKKTLELSVKDTGIGIPKDQLSAIFERFRQVQDAQTRIQHGGVGLGLYIVKKYVDFLGGTIHVESHPGEGSVFTLRIPAPEPKLSSAEKPLPLLGDDEKLPAISG